MQSIECAVIGFGGIGSKHGGWLESTGIMRVKAVCDQNSAMTGQVRQAFPNAAYYCDVDDLLTDKSLGLAVIASPHHLHAVQAIACLEAGLHVVVEKPMAIRYVDCLAMIDAAKRNDRLLTVFHNRRLDPWYQAARRLIRSGRLGKLVEVCAMNQNKPFWREHPSWRSYPETSGGLMYDWGAHLIDNIVGLAEASPIAVDDAVVSVSGCFYKSPDSPAQVNDDHGRITLRFASGAVGELSISSLTRDPGYRYKIIGEDATVVDRWNMNGGSMEVYTGDGRDSFDAQEVEYAGGSGTYPAFYADLAAHFRNGAPPLVTAESAARIIQILNAAEESHAHGGAPAVLR